MSKPDMSGELVAAPAGSQLRASGAPALRVVRLERLEPPLTLAEAEREAYLRRFSTLMVDDGRSRRGGLGRVLHAVNAWGEEVALKVLVGHEGPFEGSDAAGYVEQDDDAQHRAFRLEYESQRKLMGIKGFPRLHGWGYLEEGPAIIMEWVEGETLERARQSLAVDDEGRLSPLAAARIGRDLFELLARMDVLDQGLAHRDVSTGNVMVSTAHLPLSEQVEEGAFDLRLIDFGSAAPTNPDPSLTESTLRPRGATPQFASPEMLTCDVAAASRLRKSAAVDVYAAASVVYALAVGRPPFDLAAEGPDGELLSAYRCKTEREPLPFASAHGAAGSLPAVLLREPEVAVAVGHAVANMAASPDAVQLRDALVLVDEELGEVLEACLAADPTRRPTATQMRDALTAFCNQYASNIERALNGEPLESCCTGPFGFGLGRLSPRARAALRLAGKAASASVGVAVIASVGAIVPGMQLSVPALGWSGAAAPWQACLPLLLPGALGYGLRWKATRTARGLLRGSAGVALGCIALVAALLALAVEPTAVRDLLVAASLAVSAAAWCPMVLDYALPSVALRPSKRLPAGSAVERERLAEGGGQGLPDASDEGVPEGEAAQEKVTEGESDE